MLERCHILGEYFSKEIILFYFFLLIRFVKICQCFFLLFFPGISNHQEVEDNLFNACYILK